jgi:opacity protein-like surface antigen
MNYTKFAWAVGGGLDVNASRHLSMRVVQLDYERSRVPSFGTTENSELATGLRYSGGVIIKF